MIRTILGKSKDISKSVSNSSVINFHGTKKQPGQSVQTIEITQCGNMSIILVR